MNLLPGLRQYNRLAFSPPMILLNVICALVMMGAGGPGTQTTATREAVPPLTGGSQVVVVKLDDESINPVTARFLIQAITDAEANGSPVVIQLDTPGGLLQSTREIVKKILGSRVPVITYVSPNGSRAASAGVFITYASHVAAMAPSTNIGAAHVVGISGKWPFQRDSQSTETLPGGGTAPIPPIPGIPSGEKPFPQMSDDVMGEKVMNDTLAWIEAIARLRGRNVEWARAAVEQSKSITAGEALRMNVIDHVAENLDQLMEKIDGTTVTVSGGTYQFKTADAVFHNVELSGRQRILNALANPNIAYILLLVGFAGIAYEVTHPGLLVPGIAGVIALLLAAFSLQMLPTNYVAILLLLAGIALIIAEIKFTSYGLLTVAGATCLFFGSLALFDQPGPFIGVSLSLIVTMVSFVTAVLTLLVFLVVRAQRLRPSAGVHSYVGEIAEVARALEPEGKVFFRGSYWNAESRVPVPKGARVRVVQVDGLKLYVEPLENK